MNPQNLNGRKSFTKGSPEAKAAQAKSIASYRRKRDMRDTIVTMMSAQPDVDENILRNLRKIGIDDNSPTMQTLVCANLLTIATSGRSPKFALQAIAIIGELTGCDASSKIAAERLKLDKARLKLEKERFELEKSKLTAAGDDTMVVIEV